MSVERAGPLLQAQALSRSFVLRRSLLGRPSRALTAVDGITFDLAAGETLALVGESGCGKSTLGRLVMRLIDPSSGRVVLDGVDVTALPQRRLRRFRRDIQMIFQDPYASLNPRMNVGQILAEPLMLHGIVPRAGRRARVMELLELVGLGAHQAERYPHEFSGGQRQRIVIARALAVEPKVVVCDEAVSALDVSIRAQILNLLQDLQARLGLAYLFISHDLGVVRHVADRVAVMYLGRIVEQGPAEAVFADPRHPYTRALLSAIPVADPGARRERLRVEGEIPSPLDPPSGCHFRTRCPYAADPCRETRPSLDDDGAGHATACHFWPTLPAMDVAPAASASDPRLERLFAAFRDDAGPPASVLAPIPLPQEIP